CYLKHAYYFDITSSITFLPLPTGEIACVGHTGRSGFPLLAKLNFNAPGRPALSGGWRVENFQAKLQGFGSAYKLQKEIGNYMFSAKLETRGNAITPFKIIIKKIKVKH
ncbi:MAG: hypothetical protein GTO02_07595, partial [Candidatus Dadabacteria bacterium]|nr:hypothetical protein [Candidatus Dadabacteria bacterium]NIQ14258.1 hypothetical protein [Candidatus Dadabacteria bacterium]